MVEYITVVGVDDEPECMIERYEPLMKPGIQQVRFILAAFYPNFCDSLPNSMANQYKAYMQRKNWQPYQFISFNEENIEQNLTQEVKSADLFFIDGLNGAWLKVAEHLSKEETSKEKIWVFSTNPGPVNRAQNLGYHGEINPYYHQHLISGKAVNLVNAELQKYGLPLITAAREI